MRWILPCFGLSDEERDFARLPDHNPRHAARTSSAAPIHSLERNIASRLTNDNDVGDTPRTGSGEISDHQITMQASSISMMGDNCKLPKPHRRFH